MFDQAQSSAQRERWARFEAEALPHMETVFRVAMWHSQDRAEAEDLVQETFTEALKSFHRYTEGTNCRAWLITIMHHIRGNRWRSRRRLQLVNDVEERIAETVAYEPPTEPELKDEDILAALRRIPAQFQEVVVLSDVEELSYKEIAQALQIPTGTVMSRLSRGRKLLRAELAAFANAHGIGRQASPDESEGGKSNAMS